MIVVNSCRGVMHARISSWHSHRGGYVCARVTIRLCPQGYLRCNGAFTRFHGRIKALSSINCDGVVFDFEISQSERGVVQKLFL